MLDQINFDKANLRHLRLMLVSEFLAKGITIFLLFFKKTELSVMIIAQIALSLKALLVLSA